MSADRSRRHAAAPLLVLLVVVAAGLATISGRPLPAAAASAAGAPTPGTFTTFAGGLGEGRATNLSQSPFNIAARNGRLISVEGGFPLPAPGGIQARPGLVRAVDLATGIETVLAGIMTGGFSGDGGPATSAQLNLPSAAAIDAAGNVYITDTGNHRVRKVTPAGIITTFAGNGVAGFTGEGAAATSASLREPGAIAVSPTGDVVFADRRNYRLRKVSAATGRITTIAGNGERGGPAGDGGPAVAAAIDAVALGFDPAGNLYVTDDLHSSLRKIVADGTITTVPTPPVWLSLAVDESGNVFLGSSPGVVKMDPSGTFTPVAGTTRPYVPGEGDGEGGPALDTRAGGMLAVDGGNLYMVASPDRIRRVDGAGIITTIAGNGLVDIGGDGGQARGAQFRDTRTIRSGPTGTYLASSPNQDIRRIDPSGIVTTIYQGPFRDMAVDDTGNVFLSRDNQVWRLSPTGSMSVVAGTGVAGFTGDGGLAVLARLYGPGALAVDRAGNLYVHDYGNLRIRRIDPLGVITTHVGGSTNAYQGEPTWAGDTYLGKVREMAVGPDGALYWTRGEVGVGGKLEVRKVTCGIARGVTGSYQPSATSLAVDAAGSVYFFAENEVRRATADGTVSTVAGTGGSLPFEGVPATSVALRYPSGLAIHPSGALLVGNQTRVHRIEGITGGRTAVTSPPCPTPDAPVWGAGYNGNGQLGDGTTGDRDLTALEAPALTSVTAVSGGFVHSLAIRKDGTAWAWGWNAYGQLGDGTTQQRVRPVPVPGLAGVTAVSGGALHSLALTADGSVWAWGANNYGQLGDGTTTQRLRPVRVSGLTNVVAISAGTLHSLAVTSDGSVWAWGWNGVGQLGDGTTTDRLRPTRAAGITGATGVAAGGLHSLAVRADGSAWSWGWNLYGQLGDGTTVDHHLPAPIPGLSAISAVAASTYHSMVLVTDGSVAAWGLGHVGQLGDRKTESRLAPVRSENIYGAVAIAAGTFHSIALLADGHAMTWGWDYFGQLSRAGGLRPDEPSGTTSADHVSAIAAGGYHTLLAHRFEA
ncbi:MAG: hypothetical protein QOG82_2349 [Actinomycetota bacterium]|jgi:alpha-tubulin suppressor-like RCC1 family protein|nr:hypothetical protein [Actinomycetota bacterium]